MEANRSNTRPSANTRGKMRCGLRAGTLWRIDGLMLALATPVIVRCQRLVDPMLPRRGWNGRQRTVYDTHVHRMNARNL